MTLLSLLENDERCLPRHTRLAVLRCSTWWVERGQPMDKVGLARFLGSSLKRCVEEGMRYPKIMLLRLKQLQRAEWEPRREVESDVHRVRGDLRRLWKEVICEGRSGVTKCQSKIWTDKFSGWGAEAKGLHFSRKRRYFG